MEKVKPEIKHLKLSIDIGILEYKIHQPKKGNGCALSFMPLPVLLILKRIVEDEIKHKTKKKEEEKLLNEKSGAKLH